MKRPYSRHAIERAAERYGIALSHDDMVLLHAACHSGAAPIVEQAEYGRTHCAGVRGVTMYPVIAADTGVLVTFKPASHFRPGGRRKFVLTKKGQNPKQAGFNSKDARIFGERRTKQALRRQIAEDV